MNEYFEWRLWVEQTEMLAIGVGISLAFLVFVFAYLQEAALKFRQKCWRLLIRTSRYPDKYRDWVPFGSEPGHKVLLKWKPSDETLTGGSWVFYKNLSEANFFDKFRAGTNV